MGFSKASRQALGERNSPIAPGQKLRQWPPSASKMRKDDSAIGDGSATGLKLDGPGTDRVLERILAGSKPLQVALAVRRDALASMASVGSRHSELLRSAAAPGTPPDTVASVLEAVLEYEGMRREALLGIQDLPPLATCAAPLLASGKMRHVDLALLALHKALGRWGVRIRWVGAERAGVPAQRSTLCTPHFPPSPMGPNPRAARCCAARHTRTRTLRSSRRAVLHRLTPG